MIFYDKMKRSRNYKLLITYVVQFCHGVTAWIITCVSKRQNSENENLDFILGFWNHANMYWFFSECDKKTKFRKYWQLKKIFFSNQFMIIVSEWCLEVSASAKNRPWIIYYSSTNTCLKVMDRLIKTNLWIYQHKNQLCY